MNDKVKVQTIERGAMTADAPAGDAIAVLGRFSAVCRDASGVELWREEFDNLVTTLGKNLLLDQGLAGAAYTAAEFMGLISSTSFSAIAAGDTMASHAGWLEAGSTNAPTYANRLSAAWSAASAGVKALSAGAISRLFLPPIPSFMRAAGCV